MTNGNDKVILLLRLGVAFSFIFPAVSAFIEPAMWVGYVPAWIDIFLPREIFLHIFSTVEIFVALGVLFWKSIYPSIVAGLILVSIVVLNISEFSVVFRDIPIALMSFALALLIAKK